MLSVMADEVRAYFLILGKMKAPRQGLSSLHEGCGASRRRSNPFTRVKRGVHTKACLSERDIVPFSLVIDDPGLGPSGLSPIGENSFDNIPRSVA